LAQQGYIARGGLILDASIVPVPRNHNTRDENTTIKKGEVLEDWANKPAKRCQKDLEARWTKNHGKIHYGYKNHAFDRKHKLVRRYYVSPSWDIAAQCPAGQCMPLCMTVRLWITC
jgi:IS5 family transposase